MRLGNKGKFIFNPNAPKGGREAGKYVYIPEGVEYRFIGDSEPKLLRKVELLSQDEAIALSKTRLETEELKELFKQEYIAGFKAEGYNDRKAEIMANDFLANKTRFYSTGGENDPWRFGNDEEADNLTKTERLLQMGKSITSVRKFIRKSLKEVRLAGLESDLAENFVSCKRKRKFTDDCGEIDVDRAICGDDRPFVITKRDGEKRTIRIGVNLTASWSNKPSTYAKTIALAYCCAEALESLGYGVEIKALNSCQTSNANGVSYYDECTTTFPLKRVTEPTDIDRIGSVGLSSVSRWFDFRNSDLMFRTGSGLCYEMTKANQDFLNLDILVSTSWVRRNRKNKSSQEQTTQVIKSIKKALKQ